MAKLIFFSSLLMLFYIYLGYPVLVYLLSKLRPKQVNKGVYQPNVTILISAYNEERHIEETIKNKLGLNYPKDKLEIIVISDGSTDRTDDVVKKYFDHGVRLLRQEPRAGKTSALNLGVKEAEGDILIFSDANSIYDPQALQRLVQNFNDPRVGYVTGKMIYTNPDGTAIGDGCTLYMKYENFLRKYETKIGSIVGVDGAIDAGRKSFYKPMNPDQLPDFVLPLRVIEQGFRVVYEPEAILKEAALKSSEDEYRMRVRVSLRALWALSDMRQLLTFKRFGLFAWQLWSHKVLRYLCFIFLVGAYLGNLTLLRESGLYKITFAVQNIAYIGAFLSPFFEKRGHRLRILYVINYFSLLNIAAAHAFMKFALGQKQIVWTPRKGL
jgi:cellulose synthase/poly-beta-1,6-N-acetylglucosamine synthase-like glycosyltransferase